MAQLVATAATGLVHDLQTQGYCVVDLSFDTAAATRAAAAWMGRPHRDKLRAVGKLRRTTPASAVSPSVVGYRPDDGGRQFLEARLDAATGRAWPRGLDAATEAALAALSRRLLTVSAELVAAIGTQLEAAPYSLDDVVEAVPPPAGGDDGGSGSDSGSDSDSDEPPSLTCSNLRVCRYVRGRCCRCHCRC